MNNKNTLIALSVATIIGCGGGSGNDTEVAVEQPVLVTELTTNGVPIVDEQSQSLTPLKSFKSASFENYYKNGIYLSTSTGSDIRLFEATTADASPATSSSTGGFSSTITQESGVDEADRVKYDGEYLYIANNGGYFFTSNDRAEDLSDDSSIVSASQAAHVRVMKRNADSSMDEVEKITLDTTDEFATISGLYLADDTLSVISNSHTYGIASSGFDIWYPGEQTFNLSLFDVADPSAATKKAELEVDGYVISSRRVDNTLIVVSSYNPTVPELIYFPQTEEDKAANYKLIADQSIADLLPDYRDANGNSFELVSSENCFIPEDATNRDGHGGIVTLTTINLEDPTQISSVCVNASTQGIYATPQSIYMYGSADLKQSVVHKFSIDGQDIEYQAATSFDGHLLGRGQSQLRFSEQGDYLRLVSTEFTGDETDRFEHKLKVFKSEPGSKTLDLVAELPNANQPEKIGKDNEDIYAVRYFGDKAFIVTFESIDPLYVINLADNNAPQVESALEIVGYSSYLHPISENLILGIGQNVDPNRFSPDPEDEVSILPIDKDDEATPSDIVEGAKVALFDVSGDAKLIKEFVFPEGYTPAEYNYHALTYLAKSETEHLFALPVETWSSRFSEEQGYDIWTSNSQLQLFEVHEIGTTGELEHKGSVNPRSDENYNHGSWNDRAIVHGDLIYYVHGANVWQSLWSNPEQVEGPY